jgi:hypothetical protein
MRDTSTVAHGRSSDIIAPSFLGIRCPNPTLTPARYMQWLIPDKIIVYRISA